MPKPLPPFRFPRRSPSSPAAHGTQSFLRYLFPHTRLRARAHLSRLRHETLPGLRHRTQSRIYKYIIYRQARKLKGNLGVLQRLRGHTRRLLGSSAKTENAARLRGRKSLLLLGDKEKAGTATAARANTTEDSTKGARGDMSYQDSYAAREPGTRRKKLAGYLKAANELRQSYTSQYASGWSRDRSAYEDEDGTPGGFPDAAIVRNGDEDMILFPSYARKHVKSKPQAEPGTIQEVPGDGRDVRDSVGAGDAEFWKQQWDAYEDDNAVVDVDVRGWIYSPHKGQMSRKQRLFIGLARQLVGISAPPAAAKASSTSISPISSRESSPGPAGHHERAKIRQAQRDELLTAREAEEILRKGEMEAKAAAEGKYSEKPTADDPDDASVYRTRSRDSLRSSDSRQKPRPQGTSPTPSFNSTYDDPKITPLQKRSSWNQPANMSPAELAEANAHLMARLRHFLAIPMANTPISVFFYNDSISKQRTVYTNASGHFNVRAALDFVPTHVRILASDRLSATEPVIITEPHGVSVISDIDDTIKHSAISSGAREIFRNAFIRELGDLTIDGVREWYNGMAKMGVKFHYVSNSPWQLFPVISKFFEMAGLPPGSFHLKQYSGMMQGIFEPVAERKKSTLDKIARDFPERSFILVGDSGEADLEVYTDFVLENPGRVLAVFIRDVTTPVGGGFFDPSIGPMPGDRSSSSSQSQRGRASNPSNASSNGDGVEEDDPELKAAIEASIRHMDEENEKRSRSLFPRIDEDHPELRPKLPARKTAAIPAHQTIKLIDLSDDEEPAAPLRRTVTDTVAQTSTHRDSIASTRSSRSGPPMPPKKPVALRSPSNEAQTQTQITTPVTQSSIPPSSSSARKPPPPPGRPSSSIQQPHPLSHQLSPPLPSSSSKPKAGAPPIAPKPALETQVSQSYASWGKSKLSSAYNHLPERPSFLQSSSSDNESAPNATSLEERDRNTSDDGAGAGKKTAPPPPPPRRGQEKDRDGDGGRTGGVSTYPLAAASYVGTKASSAWSHAPALRSTAPNSIASAISQQPYSTNSNQPPHPRRTDTSSTSTNGSKSEVDPYAGMPKREALWRQRWARAEQVMAEKGVVLRAWRVGGDVSAEAERLVKKEEEKVKREGGKGIEK
ncbi:hypothetical protein BCR34DRAFT_571425 [Clohesyomyces aquaticus]|uniref:Phosphatidate phosphatase APP1 catalytic domain-containing protein n=1 Tax=Clohesyomyces aquaticus TaxID=1231657 RepID=A0A1Y1Z7J6_9PLEO|nr:hypothetical protein BCR34DRAFT_571425 [Clohesyomyces aquaticus]